MSGRVYAYLGAALALLVLAVGYFMAEATWGLGPVIGLALLWGIGFYQGWAWIHTLNMFLVSLLAGIGVLAGVSALWGIMAVVGGLIVWEMEHFYRILTRVAEVRSRSALVQHHHRRVLLVAGVGLILAVLATTIQVDFGFGLALLLSIISLAGISNAIRYLRN